MERPVTVAILGTGSRGRTFADYAERFPDRVRVVAVADPRTDRRDALADRHFVPATARFDDWRDLASQSQIADAVLVLTPDGEHVDAAIQFVSLGYHVLLEKPMGSTAAECIELVRQVERQDIIFAACHVLRYTNYADAIRSVLDSGRLGRLIGIDQLESVGWWHFAHSYVRGNWRRSDEVGPSILTKCCHDLDWFRFLAGQRPIQVSSAGGLHHFRLTNQPSEAADRCLDCAVEPDCPFSAPRLYLGCIGDAKREKWPLGVVTTDVTAHGVLKALREGPYGRCVYSCDNDVVDHQVTTVEFESGVTATLTMSAFTPMRRRHTRIMGSHGFLEGDGEQLSITDFVTGEVERITSDVSGGHDGGDDRLIEAFSHAVVTGDKSLIRSGPKESLDSHLMAFAAERSRLSGGHPVAVSDVVGV